MKSTITNGVEVKVESYYLEEKSDPENQIYNFAYRVQLKNLGQKTVKLISRHWIITDANGKVSHVRGDGVVGDQPTLHPGEEYEYFSGSHLHFPMGTMHGTYQMRTETGDLFDAEIPCFSLFVPGILN